MASFLCVNMEGSVILCVNKEGRKKSDTLCVNMEGKRSGTL